MKIDSKILIFGVGQYCKNRINNFDSDNIVAFLDNNASVGMTFLGKNVYKPQIVKSMEYDCICLMAGDVYANEMYNQLLEYGVNPEKIYRNDRVFFERKKEKYFKVYSEFNYFQNEMVIFFQHLSNTGSPRAAIFFIQAIKNDFSGITVISPCDGIIREELIELGVDVIISPDIGDKNNKLWEMIKKAKFVLLNGIYYGYLVEVIKNRLSPNKIMWWLHTGESFYRTYSIPKDGVNTEGIIVAGVSAPVCEAYKRHNKGVIKVVPFGVPDKCVRHLYYTSDKFVFAIVGGVVKIKGIDVFLDAIGYMSDKDREKCEFWVIGAEVNSNYSNNLKKIYGHINEIKWLGEIKHDELMDLFNHIDALVSSSREDMLPIVTMEAMMHSKPCIMSDQVGTIGFIEDGISGLIFKNEDAKMLSTKMQFLLNNDVIRNEIATNGRKVFEENFDMRVFRDRIMSLYEGGQN